MPFALHTAAEQAPDAVPPVRKLHTETTAAVVPHDLAPPGVVAGAIDLVFRNDNGWSIVDYKTDRISSEELVARYRAQLQAYVDAWETLTGESVSEPVFYAVETGECIPLRQE
jgi:ATP-dependent exoDNAse (exonuclease V) beta subunit